MDHGLMFNRKKDSQQKKQSADEDLLCWHLLACGKPPSLEMKTDLLVESYLQNSLIRMEICHLLYDQFNSDRCDISNEDFVLCSVPVGKSISQRPKIKM